MVKYRKIFAGVLAAAMLVTSVPCKEASAAAAPSFKTERTALYENASTKGVYTYTIKNLKKGQSVKWVLTGKGKKYATLKYSKTVAKSTTSSNKVTIKTDGNTGAKNAALAINATVYDAKGKVVSTLKNKVKLKVQATDVAITTTKIADNLNTLHVGKAYDFDADIAPKNTTSTIYWSVTSTDGKNHSSEITKDGVWTPTAEGKYTIKAMAKNSKTGKTVVYHTAAVSVGLAMTTAKQTAANKFCAVFSEDASKKVTANDFKIATTNGTETIKAKEVSFSSNGKTAYVTTESCFKDATSYTVTYGSTMRAFVASVGAVKKAVILTETVEAGKETPIEYALYDSNNMDVKAAAEGSITLSAEVINGYKTENDCLYMTTVGKTAEVTLVYKKNADANEIKVSKTITCVAATSTDAAKAELTLTATKDTPDYNNANYAPVTRTAIGETTYAHFRALDNNKKEIKYDSIQFVSSDDNALIIDNDGRLTPIKTGTIKVTVIAKEGQSEANYSFNITIEAKKTLTAANLSNDKITMSNIYDVNYKEYIDVTFQDQYGGTMYATNAECTIKETSGRQVFATYDKQNRQIVLTGRGVSVGTYNYTATFSIDGATVVSYFTVIVSQVPTTGSIGYQLMVDHSTLDMVVDGTTAGNKTATVRLKRYVGGVFAGFTSISSATVSKDGLYYGNDLTQAGTKASQNVSIMNGNSIVLTPVTFSFSNSNVGECKKAATGTYLITVNYYDSSHTLCMENIKLTLTDSQDAPAVTVKSTVSSKTVNNALALVNDCISLSDGSTIYSCTATGTTATGENITVNSGQKLHIDTISIKQIVTTNTTGLNKVNVYYTINVDTTLQNK